MLHIHPAPTLTGHGQISTAIPDSEYLSPNQESFPKASHSLSLHFPYVWPDTGRIDSSFSFLFSPFIFITTLQILSH
jgi:hypothetical protein